MSINSHQPLHQAQKDTLLKCWHLEISGMVQGLGFRPFIYRLAKEWELAGWVENTGRGVILEVQGRPENLAGFLQALPQEKPALAQITHLSQREVQPQNYRDFRILESEVSPQAHVLVPPDLAMCPDCRDEVFTPASRYYQYPFTNCTNCGPRFTLIKALPYDRVRTSMSEFSMCADCEHDYHNPAHRRFHAQPTACRECGPQVQLLAKDGQALSGSWLANFHDLIRRGKIIAVKGIGGFHLVCSALDDAAVQRLRSAKKRPFRPLAVMARDLQAVKKYCHLNPREIQALSDPAAPIVILRAREAPPQGLDALQGLAPHNPTLGVMLPYAPLHLLLFPPEIDLLVMTSGNAKGLPIVKDNEEALKELAPYVDYFLVHDRTVINRCDDSVVRVIGQDIHFYRRSRGYVPAPLTLPFEAEAQVLGLGGEMKNTFCLIKGNKAFLSQHLGDMRSLEGLENYTYSLSQLESLLSIRPLVLGYDPHPSYSLNSVLKHPELPQTQLPIQHHHAHLVSAMADNGLRGEVIGAILDGTGYGPDSRLWGFEILSGDYNDFTRHLHLEEIPLPGGERAVANPWLTAAAYLWTRFGQAGWDKALSLFPEREQELAIALQMIEKGINAPYSSSAGRLFDAVAAILGLCRENTYDGQAAIELGELALTAMMPNQGLIKELHEPEASTRSALNPYPFTLEAGTLKVKGLFAEILADLQQGKERQEIARRFHHTVAAMVFKAVTDVRAQTGLKRVVFSGGVWQNPYLLSLTKQLLTAHGFDVYTHRQVPANDGGLALGQAVAAYWRWKMHVSGNTR
ncbi:carbamoyltransferase HypF [Paradesulfitobacterium aromaticivorans]